MWVMTTGGFYSAVEHRDNPELVLVRARAKGDLKRLKEYVPTLKIREDRGADYRWRTTMTRDEWASVLVALSTTIDYDNFKNAVRRKHSVKREGIYHRVWAALTRIEGGFDDRYYGRWERRHRPAAVRPSLWEDIPQRTIEDLERAEIRECLEFAYGADPQNWPSWACPKCDQLHSGWCTDDCGRCGEPRPFPTIDESILEEWLNGR